MALILKLDFLSGLGIVADSFARPAIYGTGKILWNLVLSNSRF